MNTLYTHVVSPLIVEPYKNSFYNFRDAIKGNSVTQVAATAFLQVAPVTRLNLQQRVNRLLVGVLLLVPLINVLVLAILKKFQSTYFYPSQIGSFNPTSPLPNVLWVPGQFSADDLAAFRAALQTSAGRANHQIVQLENRSYAVWYDQNNQSVHIQTLADFNNQPGGDHSISIRIDPTGRIVSVLLNGVLQPSTTVPDEYVIPIWGCFTKALELSSRYSLNQNSIHIQIIRRGLVEIPEHHLCRLVDLLNQRFDVPHVSVSFLRNDLTTDQGIDAGGLSRDYFDELFDGLTRNKQELTFSKEPETGTFMPLTREKYSNHTIPSLSLLDTELYQKIGALMMFCYRSPRELVIGRRFHEAVFKAAFSLTPAEVNTPFGDLPWSAKLKMCRAILEAQDSNLRMVELLEGEGPRTERQWREAFFIASAGDNLPNDFGNFDLQNEDQKISVLRGLADTLLGPDRMGNSLAPIHAIAKGIHDMRTRLQAPLPADYRTFSDKIQGSINRENVANSIVTQEQSHQIRTKTDWLKEWIRDPATPNQEVQAFIKFATGSSSLPAGRVIQVRSQGAAPYIPAPVGHSCFNQIDLSPTRCSYGRHNDATKENFIQSLRELALTNANTYSMG